VRKRRRERASKGGERPREEVAADYGRQELLAGAAVQGSIPAEKGPRGPVQARSSAGPGKEGTGAACVRRTTRASPTLAKVESRRSCGAGGPTPSRRARRVSV
jgi:hypothetical protein